MSLDHSLQSHFKTPQNLNDPNRYPRLYNPNKKHNAKASLSIMLMMSKILQGFEFQTFTTIFSQGEYEILGHLLSLNEDFQQSTWNTSY